MLKLRDLLDSKRLLIPDVLLVEVLQGFEIDKQFRQALDVFAPFPVIECGGRGNAIAAAQNFRRLRTLGITVRKTIDTLIATRCIASGLPLLYRDRDFDPFVRHLGLKSAMALP